MAENILAAACESETRKAAKRMRLEIYQSSQVLLAAGHCQGVASGRVDISHSTDIGAPSAEGPGRPTKKAVMEWDGESLGTPIWTSSQGPV